LIGFDWLIVGSSSGSCEQGIVDAGFTRYGKFPKHRGYWQFVNNDGVPRRVILEVVVADRNPVMAFSWRNWGRALIPQNDCSIARVRFELDVFRIKAQTIFIVPPKLSDKEAEVRLWVKLM